MPRARFSGIHIPVVTPFRGGAFDADTMAALIDRLIAAGVECLHPLQALARGMEADALARDFRGRIAFMGGIDTQQLLVHGSPDDVRADVRRVKRLLGPCLIVSPSHEALLPNVPPENVRAMAEEAAAV